MAETVTCRANHCGKMFLNIQMRKRHENGSHADMLPTAADRMIKHINKTHQQADLLKKVFTASSGMKYSYSEIQSLDKASPEYIEIAVVLMKFIDAWLEKTPTATIEDFFRRARFKIAG